MYIIYFLLFHKNILIQFIYIHYHFIYTFTLFIYLFTLYSIKIFPTKLKYYLFLDNYFKNNLSYYFFI